MASEVVADNTFYQNVFGGTLTEAAFYDCLPKALNHVKWLTGYKDPFGSCRIANRLRREFLLRDSIDRS